MTQVFSRWLPGVTLAAWSTTLLYFYFSGRITAFLIPMFRPAVLIAGAVLALMALLFVLFPLGADCCTDDEACGHPFSRLAAGKWMTFLILILPMSVTALVSPDGFGKNAMLNRGIITDASALRLPPPGNRASTEAKPTATQPTPAPADTESSSGIRPIELPLPSNTAEGTAPATTAPPAAEPQDYLQRTPEGFIVAEVLDLLYAAQDNALRKDFEGKTVQLIGQLMPDQTNNPTGKRFKAVRMFMTCCAADARPVATLVESDRPTDLEEMSWIKIVGTATFPIENGKRQAVLKAEVIEKTAPPDETMLY